MNVLNICIFISIALTISGYFGVQFMSYFKIDGLLNIYDKLNNEDIIMMKRLCLNNLKVLLIAQVIITSVYLILTGSLSNILTVIFVLLYIAPVYFVINDKKGLTSSEKFYSVYNKINFLIHIIVLVISSGLLFVLLNY